MTDETYNAFISYAWVDNQPAGTDQSGWVSTCVDRLRKHRARGFGRKVQGDRVWLDDEPGRVRCADISPVGFARDSVRTADPTGLFVVWP